MVKSNFGKVLVTGGGGFLGGAIVKRLVDLEISVRNFSRGYYKELALMGVEQIQGDIVNKKNIENACRGIDLVFHVAAKPGVWGEGLEYYNTNLIGTCNVVAACRKNKIANLVYTSSPSVIFNGSDMAGVDESVPYPDKFQGHYSKTKALAEQHVVAAAGSGYEHSSCRLHGGESGQQRRGVL